MSRRSKLAVALPLMLVAAAATSLAGRLERAEAADVRPSEAEVLELDLAFFEARIARDTLAARDHAELARLYLHRARVGGDEAADLADAERHARRSLELRAARNGEALQVLAASLMGQHRFGEARVAAARLLASDSTSRTARALLGEIQLELGAYHEAARTFGSLLTVRNDLAVAPRYARWEEIRGHPAEARRLLRDALRQASGRHGMPRSQLAWFHLRLGDLALDQGRLGEAERELEAGLALTPGDPALLDGLARVEAARGRWPEAITLGLQAAERSADPATLGLISLGYEVLGDGARSEEYERAMVAAAARLPEPVHRATGLLLLDRGDVAAVLAQAQEDIRTRCDVYAWDLLAWALYRSGDVRRARAASRRALVMGTRDAALHFRAGAIAAAAGEPAAARGLLLKALAIDPRWHPTQPTTARALLERLPGDLPRTARAE